MKENYTPFAANIVDCEFTNDHSRIKELAGTEYLVRSYPLTYNPRLNKKMLGDYEAATAVWKKLGTYEGIDLPRFSTIIGPNEKGEPAFLIPTERIKGENLDEIIFSEEEIPEATRDFEKLVLALAKHARETFQTGGEYFKDQHIVQYVYGKNSEGKKGIYFVDFGMEIDNLGDEEADEVNFIAGYITDMLMLIDDLEEKVDFKFRAGREAFATFLDRIPKDSASAGYAKSLADVFREGKKS